MVAENSPRRYCPGTTDVGVSGRCHGDGMADHEEVASSQSIRRSTRTIQRPPRFTEADEASGVDDALVPTIED